MQLGMTDISVIVPTFNRPELLARAVSSLAAQQLERDRFEVLVVNDCGLEPREAVEAFADRLDVRLLSTPENSGLAAARNVGIAEACGRYVSFLDDDDTFYPEHLATLLDAADEHGGETIVYSDAVKLVESDEGEPLLRQMILAPATFSYDRLLLNNYIHAMSPLVPRAALEAVGGFDAELRALEDWELWLRLGARYAFHHVLRVTVDYRVRTGAINNTTRELPLHVRCTERVYERYPAEPGSQLARERATYLAQHRQVATQHAFRLSIGLVGATSIEQLVGGIEEALRTRGGDGVEYLAYVPSELADAHGDVLQALDRELRGALVLVRGADVAPEAASAVLERKAAGTSYERLLVGTHRNGGHSTRTRDHETTAGRAIGGRELGEGESGEVDDFCIAAGYVARPVPEYYADTPSGITWQPDVYPEAQRIARLVGARTIVDLGSGNGAKLAALHPEFEIVGVDIGSNLEFVRTHHPQGTWVEHDFEGDGPLPLDATRLADSVVVCADVIEHLMDPLPLLRKLHDAFERGAAAVLLSTPERALTWGAEHTGPPPNTCHVREWTIDELGALLEREGFDFGDLELTRSNDAESRMATTLAILYRDAAIEQLVRDERDARAAA